MSLFSLGEGRTPQASGAAWMPGHDKAWLLFATALALTLYCALRPRPVQFPVNEDIQHMAAFGALMASGGLAAGRRLRLRRWLAVVLVALGAAIEGLQALPIIHRDADVLDWLADLAGIVLAYGALVLLAAVLDGWRAGRRRRAAGA